MGKLIKRWNKYRKLGGALVMTGVNELDCVYHYRQAIEDSIFDVSETKQWILEKLKDYKHPMIGERIMSEIYEENKKIIEGEI